MLRTLAFVGIAAIAGRQLYKSGALQGFTEDLKRRADEARARYAAQPASGSASPGTESL